MVRGLMLVMFFAGVSSIIWMMVLGAIMVIEKNVPGGRRLAAPVGIALILVGLAVAAQGLITIR